MVGGKLLGCRYDDDDDEMMCTRLPRLVMGGKSSVPAHLPNHKPSHKSMTFLLLDISLPILYSDFEFQENFRPQRF